MKGVVFNVVEEVVCEAFSEEVWDDILKLAGLDGAYSSLLTYDDAELVRIVGAASTRIELPVEAVLRFVGERSFAVFGTRHPSLLRGITSTRTLLLALNGIVHPEVRKMHAGADVPEFDITEHGPSRLSMAYRSRRRLCLFAEGLILGAGGYFHERVEVDQAVCMLRGDDHCLLDVRFLSSPAEAE